jgi:hypothetical protein
MPMSNEAEKSEETLSIELAYGGTELAGASVGVAVGLISGPFAGAAVGVMATRLFQHVGAEVQRRWLTPRQRIRIGGAYVVAAEAIAIRLDAGEIPRSDGFFEAGSAGRPAAEELLEGVLQAAGDAYEEQKIRFLGSLYAALVFDSTVSRAAANFFIGLARSLTFRQLALMAVLWDGDAAPLEAAAEQQQPSERVHFNDEMGAEVDEMERRGLVGRGEPGGTPKRGGATFVDAGSLPPSNLTLTGPGKRLYDLAALSTIKENARSEVLADLKSR